MLLGKTISSGLRRACAVSLPIIGAAIIAGGAVAQEVERASFNSDDSVNRPENWRQWVYIGTPLTPNALNGGEAAFPEFHNVYIEPGAYAHFRRTGEFADGTQIAKELVLLHEGDACDEATGACFEVSGQGYFQGEFAGLELTVKDSQRFADEPGGWAYFSFGHQPEPYEPTATAFPTESCNACHQANAETDWVFSQFYPVLRAAAK